MRNLPSASSRQVKRCDPASRLRRRAMEPPLARGAQTQALEATPLLDIHMRRDCSQCAGGKHFPVARRTEHLAQRDETAIDRRDLVRVLTHAPRASKENACVECRL